MKPSSTSGKLSTVFWITFLFLLAFVPSAGADVPTTPVVINEVFVDGSSNYPDWIELYNSGNKRVSLKGYSLSRRREAPEWFIRDDFILAPGEYKTFVCDEKGLFDHTSFRLSSIVGEVALFSPEEQLIDAVSYNDLPRFSSLGRYPDGSDFFHIHSSPTMGGANAPGGTPTQGPASPPSIAFSHASGLYTHPFTLTLSSQDNVTVYYTSDGSKPDMSAPPYKKALSIDSNTIIRAAAADDQGRLGPVETRSYIFNETTDLAVVSVVTDPGNLWDQDIGIYAEGEKSSGGTQSQNWRHNWRRPVSIDFIEQDASWAIEGKVRIFGGVSRGRPQKSLAIYTGDRRNPYRINHALFPEIERTRYAGFILRNGGDAWLRTQIRDAFQHLLVAGRIQADYMPYRPVIVYLNGSYWGLYGLREFMVRRNLLARHDLPMQKVKILEGGHGIASDGGPFSDYVVPTEGQDYRQSLASLDIDSFLDYLSIELYSGNPDWPDGNIKCWKPESEGAQWRWILFDLDRAFNGKRGKGSNVDPFNILYARPGPHGLMFAELTKDERFVRDFCARLSVHIATTFEPDRAIRILDRLIDTIRPEMQRHFNRWRWSWKPQRLFMSLNTWEEYLDELKSYCRKRPDAMWSIMDRRFATGKPLATDIRIDTVGSGTITAEGVPLPDGRLKGNIPQNVELMVRAIPAEGYVFRGWKEKTGEDQPRVRIQAGDTYSNCAIFAPANN